MLNLEKVEKKSAGGGGGESKRNKNYIKFKMWRMIGFIFLALKFNIWNLVPTPLVKVQNAFKKN